MLHIFTSFSSFGCRCLFADSLPSLTHYSLFLLPCHMRSSVSHFPPSDSLIVIFFFPGKEQRGRKECSSDSCIIVPIVGRMIASHVSPHLFAPRPSISPSFVISYLSRYMRSKMRRGRRSESVIMMIMMTSKYVRAACLSSSPSNTPLICERAMLLLPGTREEEQKCRSLAQFIPAASLSLSGYRRMLQQSR